MITAASNTSGNQQLPAMHRRNFAALWMLAFLGFPLGGSLAIALIGPLDSVLKSPVGGAAAGLVIGLLQWIALRQLLPMDGRWVISTVIGMATGVFLSVALFGFATDLTSIVYRALITGLSVGIAQSLAMRQLRGALLWMPLIPIAYTIGWVITSQFIGRSVEAQFTVFGASGALTFQIITGLVLYTLVYRSGSHQLQIH